MARGYMYASGASEEVDYARRTDLSKAQLIALGQSKNDYVREIIAGRHDCPLGIMITLAHDRALDVRRAVASNPAASRTVMEHLANERNLAVIEALVANPAVPQDILEQLAFHRRAEVRTVVAARLDDGAYAPSYQPAAVPPELQDKVASIVPFPQPTSSSAPVHNPADDHHDLPMRIRRQYSAQ